ncbi:MAG: NAD-dependent epimerase/dehydratase family protein [Lysobacterales bacterium]
MTAEARPAAGGSVILGASGLLGRHLARVLLERAPEDAPPLRLQLRPSSDAGPLLAMLDGVTPERYAIERYALDDVEALRERLEGAPTVFLLAAAKRGRAEEMARATLGATTVVLDALAACRAPPRLLHVSSLAVYATAQCAPGSVVDESTPIEPEPWQRDAYTHLKCAQEALVSHRARRDHLRLCIARPGILVGPGALGLPGRLALPLPGGLWLAPGLDLPLPMVHLRHAAEALAFIAREARFEGERFNLLDAPALRGRAFIELLRAAKRAPRLLRLSPLWMASLGGLLQRAGRLRRGPLASFPTPYQVRAAWTPLDYRSALPALGFSPSATLPDALKRDLECGA